MQPEPLSWRQLEKCKNMIFEWRLNIHNEGGLSFLYITLSRLHKQVAALSKNL